MEERRWASIERSLNKVRRAVDGETVIEDRGLAPDTVGLGFAPGSERQPFASERSPTAVLSRVTRITTSPINGSVWKTLRVFHSKRKTVKETRSRSV